MGKLDGKLAVITGGSRGITLWPVPRRFVEQGPYVFITGRRRLSERLGDAAVEAALQIG